MTTPERRVAAAKWRKRNPEKASANSKAWNLKNPDRVRVNSFRSALKRFYGITPEDYDYLSGKQGGACAICSAGPGRRRLAVDHDHSTGKIRGLLCTNCNRMLGNAKDSASILEKAICYLEADP